MTSRRHLQQDAQEKGTARKGNSQDERGEGIIRGAKGGGSE
jgi:hypothetical protein